MTEPEKPTSRLPMVKRTEEELKVAYVYKQWQRATAEGPMKDMIAREAEQGAEKVKAALVDVHGWAAETVEDLWTEWASKNNPDLISEGIKGVLNPES